MRTRIILVVAMILAGAGMAGPSRADPVVYNTHGNAIFGFDTVAYHTLGEARDVARRPPTGRQAPHRRARFWDLCP